MLLAIDTGNTDTVFGLHDGQTWRHVWRTRSLPEQPPAHYESRLRLWFLEAGLSIDSVGRSVLSSVVPALTPVLRDTMRELFGHEPVVVGPAIYPQLPLEILRPYEIGADLVANALAAYTSYGRNCLIVDFGTALSFTTVSATGKMLGVAIAPGLQTAIRALFSNTAQLPEVPIVMPESALGQNTTHAIQAGVVLGYEGLIRFLIDRTRTELSGDCLVVATGGLVSVIPGLHADYHAVRPLLTLDGIRAVGQYVTASRTA